MWPKFMQSIHQVLTHPLELIRAAGMEALDRAVVEVIDGSGARERPEDVVAHVEKSVLLELQHEFES